MRLLWFIVGVGAGNTTRTLAILEELRRRGPELDIHFAAQGRALELLRQFCPVHPMETISYTSGGDFSPWKIIRGNLGFPARFRANQRRAAHLMRKLKPDLVLADSDFYCLGPARRMGVPLATLNNAAVIAELLRRRGVPPGCGFSGRVIEPIDAWLQHRYPSAVICPTLRPLKGLPEKYRQIPPIVRPEAKGPGDCIDKEVVVVTGGSGIGAQQLDLRGVQAPVLTFGAKLEKVPPGTHQLGFDLNVLERMKRARVLVVQGGFSSVSEAVALRRPTVVVPIAGHAEQWINARLFEEMGLGLAASGPETGSRVNNIMYRQDEFEKRCRAHRHPTNGARKAAKELLDILGV